MATPEPGHPVGDRRLRPEQQLTRYEDQWVPLLANVNLVTEVVAARKVHPDEVGEAVQLLAAAYATNPHESTLSRWPAATVVALAGFAIEGYQGGSYWPQMWSHAGYPGDSNDQTCWGQSYLAALKQLGLHVFDMPRAYVGNMLMHAGVPTYCLHDLFSVLDRAVRGAGHDPGAVLDWLTPRLDQQTFANIDQPVLRFLRDGQQFAADVVDRCLDLLSRLRAGEGLDGVGLTDRFVDAAIAHVANAPHLPGHEAGVPRPPRPRLLLEPGSGRLVLALPAVSDVSGHFTWTILADGRPSHVTPQTMFAGVRIDAAAVQWEVSSPALRLTVSGSAHLGEQHVEVMDPADPILTFDTAGVLLAASLSLPRSAVWLLHPDSADLVVDGQLREVVEQPAPAGWTRWRLRLVDLEDTRSLRWADGPLHHVRGQSTPRFLLDVVPMATCGGLPVVRARPEVQLPSDLPDPAEWTATVRDVSTGGVLFVATDASDPLAPLPSPVAGRYEIVVRGPLGRDARTRVCVVEDLHIESDTELRLLGAGGLVPAQLDATAAAGLELDPHHVDLDPATVRVNVAVTSRWRDRLTLDVAAPAMAVSAAHAGTPGRWSYGPLMLNTEDLPQTELLVRVPRSHEAGPDMTGGVAKKASSSTRALMPVNLVCAGQMRQQVEPSGGHAAGLLSYQLARAAETAVTYGTGVLTCELDGQQVRLARFQPRTLAEAASVKDGQLTLAGSAGADLQAVLWAVHAPWLGPVELPVPPTRAGADAHVTLPDEFAAAGSLIISLRVVDPWLPEPPPTFPTGNEALFADGSPSAAADALSHWLAGSGPKPATVDSGRALTVLRFADLGAAHRLALYSPTVTAELCQLLAGTPGLAEAIAALSPDVEEQATLLVRSGLAWAGGWQKPRADDEELAGVLRSQPLLGSLVAMPALTGVDVRSLWPSSWLAVRDGVGEDARTLLSGERDPHASQGRFDHTAELLDRAGPEHLKSVVDGLSLVPRRLLDPDTRLAAALELFTHRKDPGLLGCVSTGASTVRTAIELLRGQGLSEAADAIEARRDSKGKARWLCLPALSLALAMLARFAAHEQPACAELLASYAPHQHWHRLSAAAPRLVAVDLVLAEAYACSAAQRRVAQDGEPGPNPQTEEQDQ